MALQLTTLRKDRSLKEVADTLGITETALSQYESGKRIPRDEVKIRLADYYGVSVDTIFLNKK